MTPTIFLLAFADGAAQAPMWTSLVPILLMFAIFYFLWFAPMRRRQKALERLIEGLKKGDRVVTNGGLYGEVAGLEGKTVHLKVADNVRIRVAKSAIAGLEGDGEGESR